MATSYRWVNPPPEYPGRRYEPSGRVLEHHLSWWRSTGNVVGEGMIIHHKDGCGTNNDISNLEMLARGAHTNLHCGVTEYLAIACDYCGCDVVRTTRDVRTKANLGQTRFFCCSQHAAFAGKTKPVALEGHGSPVMYARRCRCALCSQYGEKHAFKKKGT